MDSAKAREVFADKAFVEKLLATEKATDVQQLLAGKGVDVTEDEVVQMGDELAKYSSGEKELPSEDELSDMELENVAGGVAPIVASVLTLAGVMAAIGAVAGVGWFAIDKGTKGAW